MNVEFYIMKDGEWFPISCRVKGLPHVPYIGDMVRTEDFFKEFEPDEWETKHGIHPFLVVREKIFRKDKIEITLKNPDEQ